MRRVRRTVDTCIARYAAPVREVSILLNPIKCVHCADYPAHDGRLLVSCDALRPETVLHELLHLVVHPLIQARREIFLRAGARYPGVDPSYYLAGDDGQLNACEEYLVRELTAALLRDEFPVDLGDYLAGNAAP